jgi:hypothetical protein
VLDTSRLERLEFKDEAELEESMNIKDVSQKSIQII